MDEPLTLFPAPPGGDPAPPRVPPQEALWRRRYLRRLWMLLATGGLSFALTTWMLVRVENPAGLLGFGPGPRSLVKAHFEALNRGDLRGAYDCFSLHYRAQLPFETYHELVASHWAMFRTREVTLAAQEGAGERVVLLTRVVASDGGRYRARFTLVRRDGRWWIDDVRWSAEPRRTLTSVSRALTLRLPRA
jgi:hypothetical protein